MPNQSEMKGLVSKNMPVKKFQDDDKIVNIHIKNKHNR